MTTILKETLKTYLEELGYGSAQEKDGMIAFSAVTDYIDYVIVVDELESNKDVLNFAVMPVVDNGKLVTLEMLSDPQLTMINMLQLNSTGTIGSWGLDGDIIYWSANIKLNNWLIELDQLKDVLTLIYNEVATEIEQLFNPEEDLNNFEPEEEDQTPSLPNEVQDDQEPPKDSHFDMPPITESKSQW